MCRISSARDEFSTASISARILFYAHVTSGLVEICVSAPSLTNDPQSKPRFFVDV